MDPGEFEGHAGPHLDREDVPFHFAMADAFTVHDAYFRSSLGARPD